MRASTAFADYVRESSRLQVCDSGRVCVYACRCEYVCVRASLRVTMGVAVPCWDSGHVFPCWPVQCVDVFNLSMVERKAFFINLYNVLIIHGLVVFGHPDSMWQRSNFFSKVQSPSLVLPSIVPTHG